MAAAISPTMEPVGPEAFAPIFPQAIIEQEVTWDSYVPIPEEVREIYSLWRPTPLFRARRLEKLLDTPAHIYYKYEGIMRLYLFGLPTPRVQRLPERGANSEILNSFTNCLRRGSAAPLSSSWTLHEVAIKGASWPG
jgi:hypothetical protein